MLPAIFFISILTRVILFFYFHPHKGDFFISKHYYTSIHAHCTSHSSILKHIVIYHFENLPSIDVQIGYPALGILNSNLNVQNSLVVNIDVGIRQLGLEH